MRLCFWATWVGAAPQFDIVMATEPVSEIVYSLLNRRCWMMSIIQTYLRIIRTAVKMGRENILPYHSCCCHGPPHIAFQTIGHGWQHQKQCETFCK